ncbi:MAG TPA: hypothetical protein VKF42_01905 [Chitinivibrionales bacterium]|jgi:hypothetical protein|nr:hypothetical protein [Chitinivibrionales bacterium]
MKSKSGIVCLIAGISIISIVSCGIDTGSVLFVGKLATPVLEN